MADFVLSAQLQLLAPKNVKEIRDKIAASFSKNVTVEPKVNAKVLKDNLNTALDTTKIRRVKVNFDVSQIREALRNLKTPPKVRVEFNASNIRPATREALKGFRPRLYFDVSGLRNQILQVLGSFNRGINLPLNIRNVNVTNINKTIQGAIRNTQVATNEIERFGVEAAKAVVRYGAFTVATTGFFKLTAAISEGIKEAINFDRELVRLAQVTGSSLPEGLQTLSSEVTRLAKEFGTSSSEILQVSVTLAQAGLSAKDATAALEAIAKTSVSATFGDMKDTGEAAIAVMQQFGAEAQDLERVLGSINAVSAAFASESEDITVAVRRAGAVFAAAGGNFDEFQAIFTSIRDTTRESAETISTGLRTIYSRLQRPATQTFLESLGISLRDVNGQFVGAFEATRRLSEAIKGIPTTDRRFAAIAEEIGGIRQLSKTIPLLQNFDKAQRALNVSLRGGNSLAKDAELAQRSLAVQLGRVREEFAELIRTFAYSDTFREFLNLTLQLSSALIKLTASLEPLLPYLGALALVGGARVGGQFAKGVNQKFNLFPKLSGGSQASVGGAKSLASNSFAVGVGITAAGTLLNTFSKYTGTIEKSSDAITDFTKTLAGAALAFGAYRAFGGIVNSAIDKNPGARQLRRRSLNNFGLFGSIGVQPVAPTELYKDYRQRGYNALDARNAVISNQRRLALRTLLPAALGVAGTVGGDVISGYGNDAISRGKGYGVGLSTAGGTLSSAGQGATVGAFIGGIPGAVAGGVGGALYGFVSSLLFASEELKKVRLSDKINKFISELDRFADGRASAQAISGTTISNLQQLPVNLLTLNSTNRQNLTADFLNNSSIVEKFFSDIAANSTTFDEFNVATKGTLANFALLANVPLDQLEEQIKNQISSQNELIKNQKTLNDVLRSEAESIIQLNAFREALSQVANSLYSIDAGLTVFGDFLSGNISGGLNSSLSPLINDASSGRISDRFTLDRISNSTFGLFGKAGERQASTFVGASQALNELPKILKRVRDSNRLGDDGSFEEQFASEVEKYGPDVAKSLTEGVKKLIGRQTNGQSILAAIDEDIFGAANQIGLSLQNTFDVLKDLAPEIDAQKSRLSQAFSQYAQAQLQALDIQKGINARNLSLAEIIDNATLSENRLRGNTAFSREFGNIQSLYGSNQPLDLRKTLQSSRNQITDIQSQLNDPNTSVERAKTLNEELAQQKVQYERARQGLDALANSTEALTAAQQDLERAERRRLFGEDIVDSLLFGSNKDKLEIGKNIRNAIGLANGGVGSLGGLTTDSRQSLLAFLKSAESAGINIGPVGSGDILKNSRKQLLQALGLSGSVVNGITERGQAKDSRDAQTLIADIIGRQNEALEVIKEEFLDVGSIAAQRISEQNKLFLDNLFNLLKQNQLDGLRAEAAGVNSQLGDLNAVSQSASDIAKRLGIDSSAVTPQLTQRAFKLFEERGNILAEREKTLGNFTTGLELARNLTAKNYTQSVIGIEARTGVNLEDFRKDFSEFSNSGFGFTDEETLSYLSREISNRLSNASPAAVKDISSRLSNNTKALRGYGLVGNALASQSEQSPTSSTVAEIIKDNSESLKKLGNSTLVETNAKIQALNTELSRLTTEIQTVDSFKPPIYRNSGGKVPGSGNRDTVRAMLTPGEYILNKDAVNAIGVDNLERFNNGGKVSRRQQAVLNILKKKEEDRQRREDHKNYVDPRKADALARGAAFVKQRDLERQGRIDNYRAIKDNKEAERQDRIRAFIAEREAKRDEVRGRTLKNRFSYFGPNADSVRLNGATSNALPSIPRLGSANQLPSRNQSYDIQLPNIPRLGGGIDRAVPNNQRQPRQFTLNRGDALREMIAASQREELRVQGLIGSAKQTLANTKTLTIGEGQIFDFLSGNRPLDENGNPIPPYLIEAEILRRPKYIEAAQEFVRRTDALYGGRDSRKDPFRRFILDAKPDVGPASDFIRKITREGLDRNTINPQNFGVNPDRSKTQEEPLTNAIEQYYRDNPTKRPQVQNALKRIKGFASGGSVPGQGYGDSVPAMLTPGEFVVKKSAVNKVGLNQLNKINSGQVSNSTGTINMDQFRSVVQQFSTSVDKLSSSLSAFPHEITLTANHKVEVIFNGAEVLSQLQPEIVRIAIDESKKALNNMIERNMPAIGKV